jgi:hypothetical protein
MGYRFLQQAPAMDSTAPVITDGPDLVRKLDELGAEVTKLQARIERMKPAVPTPPDPRRSHVACETDRREAR